VGDVDRLLLLPVVYCPFIQPAWILAIVFGLMVVFLPFRVFREIRFGDKIIVKRYILPDQGIEYRDVTSFDKMGMDTSQKGISLYMLNYDSLEEFEKIVHNLMSVRKLKLKKK